MTPLLLFQYLLIHLLLLNRFWHLRHLRSLLILTGTLVHASHIRPNFSLDSNTLNAPFLHFCKTPPFYLGHH